MINVVGKFTSEWALTVIVVQLTVIILLVFILVALSYWLRSMEFMLRQLCLKLGIYIDDGKDALTRLIKAMHQ